MPRVHSVPGRGREGKQESCVDLGGRGKNPMQGKCLLEPAAAAEAGRKNKDLWRLEQGLRLGWRGDSLHPGSEWMLWFSLASQARPRLVHGSVLGSAEASDEPGLLPAPQVKLLVTIITFKKT